MLRFLLILELTCVAFGANAKPERAERVKVVVFPVVPLPGEVELKPAQQMTRAIIEEFKQQKKFEVIEGQAPTGAVTGQDTRRRPARSDAEYRAALEQLKDGAKQAQRLRFPQAIRALRKGIDGLTRNLDLLDNYDRLVDAKILLAVAYFRRGQQRAGTDVLQHVARLRPDQRLDRSKYPPVFTVEFNKAVGRALERPRGALRVTSAPAGANVILNGRSMGTTPLLIDEIIPGEHHLVVRLGDKAWGKTVAVREAGTHESHADLGAGGPNAPVTMGDALAANRFDKQVRKTARKLGKDAGGDFVLVSAMARGAGMFTIGVFLGDVRKGEWTELAPLSPDYDMLSDAIEAHNLSRQVSKKIEGFSDSVGDGAVPLIEGKEIRSAKRGAGLKEAHVSFVHAVNAAMDVSRAAAVGGRGRGPISATAMKPVAPPRPVVSVAPPSDPPASGRDSDSESGNSHRPIGSRGPVATAKGKIAVRPPPTERPAPKETPLRKPRKPLTRDTAGRGAVVSTAIGIDESAESPPGESGGGGYPSDSSIAAVDIDSGASGPLAEVNLEAEVAAADRGLMHRWWFWTAVGIGVAALGGGGYLGYRYLSGREADSVTVFAVWY